jgi:hypothetical protein
MHLPLYVTSLFSFAAFRILSLFCVLSVLIMMYLGGVSPLVLEVCCSVSFLLLDDLSFSSLGKFCAIILQNRLSVPLVCTCSPYSTPMIHRFGLFMVSQIAWMFYSYFLHILSASFTVWSNSSALSSIPDTLFSICSTCSPSFQL